jgi:hypothetical protein
MMCCLNKFSFHSGIAKGFKENKNSRRKMIFFFERSTKKIK